VKVCVNGSLLTNLCDDRRTFPQARNRHVWYENHCKGDVEYRCKWSVKDKKVFNLQGVPWSGQTSASLKCRRSSGPLSFQPPSSSQHRGTSAVCQAHKHKSVYRNTLSLLLPVSFRSSKYSTTFVSILQQSQHSCTADPSFKRTDSYNTALPWPPKRTAPSASTL